MLQGISDDVSTLHRTASTQTVERVATFLGRCGDPGCGDPGGGGSGEGCELLRLPETMKGCRVKKVGGKIYTAGAVGAQGGALAAKL